MDVKLLIYLSIPAAVQLIGMFVDPKRLKIRLFLIALAIIALIVTYLSTKDDADENQKLKSSLNKIERILKNGEGRTEDQTKVMRDGFQNLKSQILASGDANSNLTNTLKQLEAQMNKIDSNYKSYFQSAIIASQESDVFKDKKRGLVVNNEYIKIPEDSRNSILIDSKNSITVVDYKSDENKVLFKVNGVDHGWVPGNESRITNDQGEVRAFVYQGKVDNRFVFYMHDL